jgi:hypothetical protein
VWSRQQSLAEIALVPVCASVLVVGIGVVISVFQLQTAHVIRLLELMLPSVCTTFLVHSWSFSRVIYDSSSAESSFVVSMIEAYHRL